MRGMSPNSSEQLSKREQVALSILLQAMQRGEDIRKSHVTQAYRLADEFLKEGEKQEREQEKEEKPLFWHLWRDEQFVYMQLSKDPTVCFYCSMKALIPRMWQRGEVKTPIQNSIRLEDTVNADKAMELLTQAENKKEGNNNSSEGSGWLIWRDIYMMDDNIVFLQQVDNPNNCWSAVVSKIFGDKNAWHPTLERKAPSSAHKLKIIPTPQRAWEMLSQEPDGTEKAPNATGKMWVLWHDSGSLHLRRVSDRNPIYTHSLKDSADKGWNRTIDDYEPPVSSCYFLDFFPGTRAAVSIYNCSERTAKIALWLVWRERSSMGDVVRAQPVGAGDALFSCWCKLDISNCNWVYSTPKTEIYDSVLSVGFPSIHEACRLLLGNNK